LRSDGLLGPIFARGGAAAQTTDAALLQAMLDVEAALAHAWAQAGAIPADAAEAIAAACRADAFDLDALGREAARHAQPVVGLVAALREAVGDPAAEHVHYRATSQDVVDSALMLVARRALAPLVEDLAVAGDGCAAHAEAHARTPMIGRTLLQQAQPTTFGLKAVGWMAGLDAARAELTRVRDDVLAVQLGGPVGALHAPEVVEDLARRLGLRAPALPWHGDRTRVAALAGALGQAAGACAKVAGDVALLAQTEVEEVREGGEEGRGGSSSMPHKRNPVGAVSARACAARVPGLVGTLLGVMAGEHERAAGAWQAEWQPLLEALALTGSAAAWTAELVRDLHVDASYMTANVADAAIGEGDPEAAAALVARALAARGTA
jgi:3-carboxy-cis,cis-muconate cycloisomerase